MPRKARIDAPGALHHIMIRGIEKKAIFKTDHDRKHFVDRLDRVLTDTSTPCFAWALLPNHVHMLLRTGGTPIATVMQRLLTGYAQAFNRRYGRHGQLFQNRYKSVLCEEDTYLLELVRYIHLNPVRAGLVQTLDELARFPWTGHKGLAGFIAHTWQDTEYVLRFFGTSKKEAKKSYISFVRKGLREGKRSDLTGGGLIRSAGGWAAVKEIRREGLRIKGDERILGSGRFVEDVLRQAGEAFETRTRAADIGITPDRLMQRISDHFEVDIDDLKSGTKASNVVTARSALCFLAVRKLGLTAVETASMLGVTASAVSKSVIRGQSIVIEADLDKLLLKV